MKFSKPTVSDSGSLFSMKVLKSAALTESRPVMLPLFDGKIQRMNMSLTNRSRLKGQDTILSVSPFTMGILYAAIQRLNLPIITRNTNLFNF